jgi:hypothetical protein
VRPPPADIKDPVPTPFPPFLNDLKPGDGGTNAMVNDHAAELHDAARNNSGNKKAENYIAQAAAAAAALYIMSEIPPPANALVAKVVGQLVMSLFGDGDLDPGEAMFIGQLIQAAISGDPTKVSMVLEKSDIGLKALDKVSKELGNNPDIVKMLSQAGQDPAKMAKLISDELNKRKIDLSAAEKLIREKLQGQPDLEPVLMLLTKRLPARSVPAILSNIDDSVKLGKAIIKATAEDSMIKSVAERKELLEVMAKRWLKDPTVMTSDLPALYQTVTGTPLK